MSNVFDVYRGTFRKFHFIHSQTRFVVCVIDAMIRIVDTKIRTVDTMHRIFDATIKFSVANLFLASTIVFTESQLKTDTCFINEENNTSMMQR